MPRTASHTPAPAKMRSQTHGHGQTGSKTRARVATPSGLPQPRPVLGPVRDSFEAEAERAADQIVHSPGAVPKLSGVPPIGTTGHAGAGVVGPAVARGLPQASERGRPLAPRARNFFDQRFGHDFGAVRLHTGPGAEAMNRELGSHAFTWGRDIYFASRADRPDGLSGQRLLAHELAHVVQQASHTRIQRDMPSTRVGPVSGQGGLIHDESRRRFNVIVGPQDTPRTIADRLLPLFTGAQPFTPEGATTPLPLEAITAEDLAKALLVYHQHYLPVPAMTNWRVGLRLPLPIRQDPASGEGVLHPSLIRMWADTFDPAWTDLLDRRPAPAQELAGAELSEAAREFLRTNDTALARGIALSTRALTNAVEAEPLVREVFSQAGTAAFDVALQFMDSIVVHQVGVLAGQNAGRAILDQIRQVFRNAPSTLSEEQQTSLARANRMLNRTGVFEAAEGQAFGDLYAAEVSGLHCMSAVYLGLEALLGEETSRSIQQQVTRDAREVMRRTGRDTNHMDRIMRTVRARGLAGPETAIRYNARQDEWRPDPQTTVLGMTHPGISGWYFFGFSIHGAYHSVILAVDMTDPDTPHIYWMDQFSEGFTNEVTDAIEDEMRTFRPDYGFAETRLWQIFPPSDLLIPLD